MADDTKQPGTTEAKVRWSPETLGAGLRDRTHGTIGAVPEEELEAALRAGLKARVGDQERDYRCRTRRRARTMSSAAAWRDVVRQLQARHLDTPVLAVTNGNFGPATALREAWARIGIQRCTAQKLRNLTAKAPARLREETAEDFRRVLYAETAALVQQRRVSFLRKWRLQCPAVAGSFAEPGDELFTFLHMLRWQWKAPRIMNALERV